MESEVERERAIARTTEYLADRWLNAFGAVERERVVTGDPTAIPKGSYSVDGGAKGKSGDVADILTLHADVEMELKEWPEPVRDLVTFIHGACVSDETIAIRYFFNDGSGYIDLALDENGKEVDTPQNADRCEAITERKVRIDWAKLPRISVEAALENWGCSRPEFLSWRYLRFRAKLIRSKGLDLLAASRVDEGISTDPGYMSQAKGFENLVQA